jgi:PAS domain S-box-containing protein
MEMSLAEFKLAGRSHFTIVCQDITVRKQAEKELRESRERLSRVVQTGIAGIAFGNSQGAIIEVNDAFCRLTGYTREELVEQGVSWKSLTAPEFAEADRRAIAALRQNSVYGPYEKEYIRKDGRRLPISVSAAVLPDKVDEHVVFIVDNSRRKKAEQELRALNAALENTVVDRTRNVRLLQDVAVIANEAESVQEAFKAAVETICGHAGWPAGRAFLNQPDGASDVFQQVGPWHWELSGSPKENKSPERLIQRVITSGSPARLNNATEMVNYFGTAVEEGQQVKSAYAFPVQLGSKVWGVLEFLITPNTIPSNELLQAMTHLCTQLGRVVERRQLQQELIDAVWNQHSRFGQELHDGLGQELTGIRMMAETLRWKLDAKSLPEAEAAAQLTQFIQDAQDHTRQISKGLFPVDIFAHGLTAALEELADHTSVHAKDLDCAFVSDHSIQIPGNELATHLFRIAQEAVNNAIKHSQAEQIEISLCEEPPWLTLEITDDGTGIRETDMAARRGMGLQIMRYRANAIGGLLTFHPGDDRGTKVRCILERPSDKKASSTKSRNSAAHCG